MSAREQTESIRGGLSARESLVLSRLAGAGREIISIDDIEATLDVPPATAREIASRLAAKGWLDRLLPGTYLIIPLAAGDAGLYTVHEYRIASHVAAPMYIGYYTALSHHGLTEQVPRTVYVVTPTRARDREIHGVPYRVTTVTERKFFGREPTSIEGTTVHVSDMEKTLVDCADHPEFCGGVRELARALVAADEQGCSWTTVGEYLERLDNGAATKRIVYLADQLGIDLPTRGALVDAFTSGYSLLDPTHPESGPTTTDYRLRLNITPEQLGPTKS